MASKEVEQLAAEIFNADPKIIHQGIIDLEGNVLLDQSSAASTPMEPDPDRIAFYNQLGLRRNTREYFDEAYGKTDYIHITREKNAPKKFPTFPSTVRFRLMGSEKPKTPIL